MDLTNRELFAVKLRRQKKEQTLDKKRLNLYTVSTSSVPLVLGTLEQQLSQVMSSGKDSAEIVYALLQILSGRAQEQDSDLYNDRVSEALDCLQV